MERDKTPSRSEPPGLKVWSTTFADILTLVLSFFIATISVSPLNPASEAAKKRPIPTAEPHTKGLASETPVESNSGTSLAVLNPESGLERPVEVVELDSSDFDGSGERLTQKAGEMLKKAVNPGGYGGASVRIESCAPGTDEALALRFGTAVRRQVFDAGGSRPTVRLAVLNGDCRSIVDLKEGAVTRVTIRRTE